MKIQLAAALLAVALGSSESTAATLSRSLHSQELTTSAEFVQHWRGGRGWGPGYRAGPGYGRPYWYARPWVRRPYYGTIVAGVALGTLITVAAVGLVPRRPAPDLCWYWADPYRNRGYWDYCY